MEKTKTDLPTYEDWKYMSYNFYFLFLRNAYEEIYEMNQSEAQDGDGTELYGDKSERVVNLSLVQLQQGKGDQSK